MPVLRGSCLCGGVKFEISGPLIGPSNCHCSMCRKQHGAAFRSRARVQASDLKWVQGEDLVTFYESSPGTYRGFCRVCGSPIVTNSMSGRRLRSAIRQQRHGLASHWRPWTTTRACVRTITSLLLIKPHGSKSLTVCRNTQKVGFLCDNLSSIGGLRFIRSRRRVFRAKILRIIEAGVGEWLAPPEPRDLVPTFAMRSGHENSLMQAISAYKWQG
jgi:hypothetical protein